MIRTLILFSAHMPFTRSGAAGKADIVTHTVSANQRRRAELNSASMMDVMLDSRFSRHDKGHLRVFRYAGNLAPAMARTNCWYGLVSRLIRTSSAGGPDRAHRPNGREDRRIYPVRAAGHWDPGPIPA